MSRNLYPATLSNRAEIDLRREFDAIIYGGDGKIAHGHKVLVRNMRRNANLTAQYCVCKTNRELDASPRCSYCFGEGYLWDETWADSYCVYAGEGSLSSRKTYAPPGQIRSDGKTFYFRYDTIILDGDKIVEVKLDTEGRIQIPYRRTNIYKPNTIQEMRSDAGRVEFLAVHCREEDAIRLENY